MTNMLLSEYRSMNRCRVATIWKTSVGVSLSLFENDEHYDTIVFTDKSMSYAQDAAENFVEYIGKFSEIKYELS